MGEIGLKKTQAASMKDAKEHKPGNSDLNP